MRKAVRLVDTRQFLRHPLDVPLRCVIRVQADEETGGIRDISDGGAAFFSPKKYRKGQGVDMTFPVFADCPVLHGNIVWSMTNKDAPGSHINGVKFADNRDKQMLRLVEQICHIMSYRVMQEHLTGKAMSADEAAREWMSKYAESFPE
ncbi:MAG: PilZ domain-containing protein [bacterium]